MRIGRTGGKRTFNVMFTSSSWGRYLPVGIIVATLFCCSVVFAGEQKHVLFISSYHPNFPTFFQQIDGLGMVLDKEYVQLDVEYMDSKRFSSRVQWGLFKNSLQYKFENLEPYDVIIVADDNALRFALEQQHRLFQNIPIVFMGVNDVELALAQNNNPQITGVVEAVSMIETVEIMIKLQPKARRIVAIVDNTPSGQNDLKKFYGVAERFSSYEFSQISLADNTWPDFLESLRGLDEDSAVLLLSAYIDKNSETYLFEEGLGKIRGAFGLPVFHLWHHGIGAGLIGGKVISHFEQGRAAAAITKEILTGTPVSAIEVQNSSPNKYVFDYSELQRNHIDKSLLPEDSDVLNVPASFYGNYKKEIWVILTMISILTVSLLVSIANIVKRLKVEKELKVSEERLNLAMEAVADGVWDWNIETGAVFYSQGWATILSEEVVSPNYEFWESRIHPEDKDAVQLSLQKNLDGRLKNWEMEHRLKTKAGNWKWVLGRGDVVERNDRGEPVRMLGTMTDISERRRNKEALRMVAASGHLSSGGIFPFLVQQISAFTGVRWVIIAHACKPETGSAQTVAVWSGDRLGDNFIYALKDTPCENVLSDGVCFYPSNVQQLFPEDQLLMEMDAESYWGTPLLNTTGEAIGLMALVHDQPIEDISLKSDLLEVFAARAASELERLKIEMSLQKSEEKYRVLFENISEAVFVSQSGIIVFHNPRTRELTGYSADELKSLSFNEFIHENDLEKFMSLHSRLLNGEGFRENCAFRFIHRNNRVLWGEINIVVIEWEGKPAILNFMRDITERKRFEEKLAQKEIDLRKSQQIARLGSWRLNLATNQVEWTEELYNMYGFDSALAPPPYTEHMKLFTPDSWKLLSTSLARTTETGIPYELELEMVRKDGSNGWMWVRGETVSDAEGKVVGLWGAAQDITERKQTELALKESEDRFKALHNASFGGIAIHDKGIILECNKGLSEITGYEPNELVGMNGLYLITDDTRDKVIQNIEAGYENPYEATGVRKNGELYPLQLEGRQIPYKGKNVRVVEFRDITSFKRAEKEKEELESKLRQAQKMEAVGRLAGGVAHDFNNMLNVIIGYADMAMEDVEPSYPLYAQLEEIRNAGMRSGELISKLLAFARKQTISPRVININTTVAGMLRMLQRLIGEDIDLMWLPGEEVWPVRVDSSQVDQILANLCVNARDAIADVGKITIETGNVVVDEAYCSDHPGFTPGEHVLLAVSDNGCGMNTETLENIFEPFFTTKDGYQGTGLGLATVYGAVKQNNGFISVYSEPGEGTTFKIYLPRYRAKSDRLLENAKAPSIEHGGETVLLVEDEIAILRMTTQMLERLGYQVLASETPGEAVCLAKEHADEIHLIITDVIMPEMNGRDLVDNILSIQPNLKCLFMSGYTANVIAHHGVLEEGVNFIQKPFSRGQLGAKIRDVLDGGVS